ncbi:hypothetical protein GGH94_000688 [Coemansia aciculifera]|uniref:Uncharacterized protein n=1 Tax=Coemansia aciculifera TaxID=417176 RepID=A0A9W8IMQ2_9FUNG|nr:hypothetical protein GGH94_000688 [Coemansia aciculifera]
MDVWECRKRPRLDQCRRHDLEGAFRLVADYLVQPDSDNDQRLLRESSVDRLRFLQPLAAVCHSWRRAVLPLLYQTAACSIKELPRHNSSTTTLGVGQDYLNHVQRTNLDLIVSGGYQKYVRRLAIDLAGDVSPDQPITLLTEAGFGRASWPKIKRLRLSHWHGQSHNKDVYSVESLARLNAYLLHTVPKLTSIKYISSDDRRHYSEFPLDGLLSSMLSRLTDVRITSGLVPDMCSSAFLPRLVSLTLRSPIYAGAAHLPRIFAETLKHLHIGFSSTESIWGRFYVADDAQTVQFKQLKSLVLEYSEAIDDERRAARAQKENRLYGDSDSADVDMDDSLYTYYSDDSSHKLGVTVQSPSGKRARPVFSKLQHLSIHKYPFSISRVLRHFQLDCVPHISIRDIRKGWDSLDAAMVSEMSSLRVHVEQAFESRKEEQRYQVWVNRLFSVSSRLTNLHLQASTTMPLALPDVIGLTRLVTLSFSMRVDLCTIPNLLSRLTHLRHLAMHIFPRMNMSSLRSLGVLESGDYDILADLPPLSCSLQHLVAYIGLEPDCGYARRLADDEGNDDPLEIERELTWLMARIPSLETLKTEEWTSGGVSVCIGELMACGEIHPYVKHLGSLEVSVWKY